MKHGLTQNNRDLDRDGKRGIIADDTFPPDCLEGRVVFNTKLLRHAFFRTKKTARTLTEES